MISDRLLNRLIKKGAKCAICEKAFTAKDEPSGVDSLKQKNGGTIYYHYKCFLGLCTRGLK